MYEKIKCKNCRGNGFYYYNMKTQEKYHKRETSVAEDTVGLVGLLFGAAITIGTLGIIDPLRDLNDPDHERKCVCKVCDGAGIVLKKINIID